MINKADFLAAEPWDMRLGPALWSRFTETIEPDDFNLKHHIYSELAALPVKEFNMKMREIMAGTKEGKRIVKEIVDEVKNGLKEDEFNEAMGNISGNDIVEDSYDNEDVEGFDFDELTGNKNSNDSDDNSDDESWNLEELL